MTGGSTTETARANGVGDVADIAATVLAEEARRHDEQEARAATTSPIDVVLPGVDAEEMPLRDVFARGGKATVAVLFGLVFVDHLDTAAFHILAPDIQKSLGMSDGAIAVVGALAGFLLFVAAVPLGALADRKRRTLIAAFCTALWAAFAVLTGFVHSVWQLVLARTLTGIGKANEQPVQSAILADAYPPEGRGRIFAIHRAAIPVGLLVGPALAGGVAALAGGSDGWRWAFVVLAIPAAALAVVVSFVREPARGRYEQLAVLGAELAETEDELPTSIGAAFARLKKVKTFYFLMSGLGAFGFAITTVPIYLNLILEDHFGLGAGERGLVATIGAAGSLVGALIGGRYGDRLFRRNPQLCMYLVAGAIVALGVGFAIAVYMPNVVAYTAVLIVAQGALFAGVVPSNPVVAAITPYRLRSMGFAMVGLYLSLVGGLGGALVMAGVAEALGDRMAVAIMSPVSCVVAAVLVSYGAQFIRGDIEAAAIDVLEERDERARIAAGGELAMLQVRNLDFSYGSVQVLFDVNVDVRRGEVLALLGTNGAGKSTLLRAISGLALADRGAIRLNGRTVTLSDPGTRVRLGIVQMPGGRSVFPNLSVRENLRAGAYTFIWDKARVNARIDEVIELFPRLAERLDQPAGTLSGGEQQMLGLASALLLEPEVLLIDELSLGLAPVVVQQLLEIVERLKAGGLTMVIVEQSVNVALAVADRAVFMEKGQVRFEGQARDLLERDDLLRAVFLGGVA